MHRPIITLTTDFGTRDSYVAQMKGVILGINPQVQLVDVTHDILPQDVRQAALVLDEAIDAFPAQTIHLVVVDPGVGTDRRIVGAELGGYRFVAPDNGVLSPVARRHAPRRCVQLTESRFWRQPVSNTFHGRDVMGPVAAHWSLGVDLAEFGPALEEPLIELPVPLPRRIPDGVEGEVIRVDSFGNLITNIEQGMLPDEPAARNRAIVEVGSHRIAGIALSYAEHSVGALLAVVGSSGRLEIAVNQGSAADVVGLRAGTCVRLLGCQAAEEDETA